MHLLHFTSGPLGLGEKKVWQDCRPVTVDSFGDQSFERTRINWQQAVGIPATFSLPKTAVAQPSLGERRSWPCSCASCCCTCADAAVNQNKRRMPDSFQGRSPEFQNNYSLTQGRHRENTRSKLDGKHTQGICPDCSMTLSSRLSPHAERRKVGK